MEKKALVYLLVASENIIFAAANVAISLNKYLKDQDFDILIYHTGLSENNKQALEKIPHVRLHQFEFPSGFEQFMLSNKGLPQGRWRNKNSLLALAHYEVFNLLNYYKVAVWLDVDMSIQGDISELTSYIPFAMAKDLNWNSVWKVRDQFTQDIPGYDMDADSYISACIVVSDNLPNYQNLASICYDMTKKYAKYLKNPDQAIFSLIFQKYNIIPKELPWNDFVCHAHHDAASLAKIVHFGTDQKVWNDSLLFRCFPEWFRTHLVWLSLGGDDFDRTMISSRSVYAELRKNGTPLSSFTQQGIRYYFKHLILAIIIRLYKNKILKGVLDCSIVPRFVSNKRLTIKDILRPVYRKFL